MYQQSLYRFSYEMAKNHHESVVHAMCNDILGYFSPPCRGNESVERLEVKTNEQMDQRYCGYCCDY